MGIWPTAEPPKSYLLFAAMSMFGAVLGRKVWYSQDFRHLWPMLNMLLIGPSGIGKSTSIELASRLLQHVPSDERPQFIIGGATPEKLHEDLVPNPHAILFASELANFFNRQKYMEGMIPYVTELLDYRPVEKRTKGSNILRINEPSVTVIGGSTVDWLQGQLPDSASSGGFLARFFIVKEDYRSQRVANPDLALSRTNRLDLENRRAQVFDEFYKLVHMAEGPVKFLDYGVADKWEHFYNNHQPPTGHLAPFAARAAEFILRLSMLLALSCHRDFITEEDMGSAIQLYGYTESRLAEVIVPFTVAGKLQAQVLQAVGPQGASIMEIRKAVQNSIPAQEVEKYLQSLVMTNDLRRDPEGKFIRCR